MAASTAPGATHRTATPSASSSSKPSAGEDSKRTVVVQGFEKKMGFKRKMAEELEQSIFKVACPQGESLADSRFKEYKFQYKRICTLLRRNTSLAGQINAGRIQAKGIAAMDDEALMADSQRTERKQFKEESLQEALGMQVEDSAHWIPSSDWTCPRCESTQCVYIQTFKGYNLYEDNQEPVVTVRCTACKHLWSEEELDGGRAAAGMTVGLAAAAVEVGQAQTDVAEGKSKTSSTAMPRQSAAKTPMPSIWGEGERSQEPTWLFPAASM
mmetsp:Transcript_160912/g.283544  ORF Transcript_160912/g.283544 Transcript_160912/m.283544 type:complete len:270 (-) Transcript_160912:29-838(-)